ncbi:hypothetical protein QFZ24_003988 [Streptomyces phaeochromogenes]|uniref:hypothetical protein n=1 Tax=Streptomyces phaeochromogenes TaxID=1923 RepID=UPI00279071DC|nr:hypothetical protein [Streptomyces phaeochromogenes]MDQ0950065.1 hypothetical protein [Streptomyces phaeochromogenes]
MRNRTSPVTGARAMIPLAAATVLLATGCGSGDTARDERNGKDTEPVVATSFANAPKAYPLDAYRPTAAETSTVDHAVRVLAGPCLKKFGVTWPAYEASGAGIPLNARKYGPTDLDSVRVYGYKPPLPDGVTRQEAVTAQRKAQARDRTITPVAAAVYTGTAQEAQKKGGASTEVPAGVPEGGCHGQARRAALADRAADDLTKVQTLFFEASATTKKDPGTVALDKRWSACMQKAGLTYPDPLAAADDETWRTRRTSPDGPHPSFPAPSAKEIATAEADVRCKAATGYVAKRHAIESGHQKRLIEKNAATLTAVNDRKRRMVERAETVVAKDKK